MTMAVKKIIPHSRPRVIHPSFNCKRSGMRLIVRCLAE
jgi:hypothetical protein